LLLAGIPGSARGESDLARELSRERLVFALDLPGFGGSSVPAATGPATIVAALLEALAALGIDGFDVVASGESGSIGCLLAAATPDARAVLLDPVPDDARDALVGHMADVTPRGDGTHLLRDRCLWRPWFETTPARALDFGTDPDVPRLQRVLADWMRGGTEGRTTLAAALAHPLAPVPNRTHVVALPDRGWTGFAAPLALARDNRLDRAAAILGLLGHGR
jgi:pimeloyl-ACP methyl ester carboxylesterase